MLMENSGSINFIKDKQLVDCQALKEFIGEEESGRLTINDIIDFEKCVEFMDALKSEQDFSNIEDTKLIKTFVENIKKSQEKTLEARFQTYTSNFSKIKTFYDSKLNISETSKQIIKYICQKSYFILKNTNDNYFKCLYLKGIDFLINSKNINKIGLLEERPKLENNHNKKNSIEKKQISSKKSGI